MLSIHWFRRDLRLEDNASLYHALRAGLKVQPIFIFDKNILGQLDNTEDARVNFIYQNLVSLNSQLAEYGSSLKVYYGKPLEVWLQIIQEIKPSKVFANSDYEPIAIKRDHEISLLLEQYQITFETFKDQCIFEKSEVVKDDGKPYTVFTPYSRKWKAKLQEFHLKSYPTEKNFQNFAPSSFTIPAIETYGFKTLKYSFPALETTRAIIKNYQQQRDFPSLDATSHLGIHFRFGTISIREKARKAMSLSEIWINELIWRDFYMQILWHFPHVVNGPFRKEYDGIAWRNNEPEFEAWCQGKTGYPIVDAGMRQLNSTGFMHNRVRMITASFLTKHLLIDWRWGEAYFAKKLLDFDLSANNGGWQWAAGCGTDAAPYFRIFSPAAQTEKFDKSLSYIKQWVPELNTPSYPAPIVKHEIARARCLSAYKQALAPK